MKNIKNKAKYISQYLPLRHFSFRCVFITLRIGMSTETIHFGYFDVGILKTYQKKKSKYKKPFNYLPLHLDKNPSIYPPCHHRCHHSRPPNLWPHLAILAVPREHTSETPFRFHAVYGDKMKAFSFSIFSICRNDCQCQTKKSDRTHKEDNRKTMHFNQNPLKLEFLKFLISPK